VKKKLFIALMMVVLIFTFAVGCSKGDVATEAEPKTENEPSDASEGVKEIAVLVPSADHGWTGAVLTYAKEKAEELTGDEYNVTVYAATDAKNQQEQIDDLLAAKTMPAGIVILPYDNTMESSLVNVASADVPFIMFDRIIDSAAVQEKVTANVKGDNNGIGYKTAQRFVELGLKPGDPVYVMIGDTSSVPEMRNAGFKEGLVEAGWTESDLANVEYSSATGWSRSTGKQIFIDWINGKTVEEISKYKYIFTHDDEIGMGILEALSGTEIEESKKTALYDSLVSLSSSSGLDEMYQVLKGKHSNSAYPEIIANFDLFSVTYDPGMIKTAIQDMVDVLSGKTVEKDHVIPVDLVDPTNVNDYQGF